MKQLLLSLAFAALAVPASATDFLVFTASTEHNVIFNNATVVARYDLRILDAQGGNLATVNLGKPAPAAPVAPATTGDITVNLSALPAYNALARVMVTMVVDAVGPGGVTASLPSAPFDHQTPPAATGQPSGQHR